jgi:hypothetical protein
MALALLAATQALLLGTVILTARGERRIENRLLAAMVLTIGAMVGLNVVTPWTSTASTSIPL